MLQPHDNVLTCTREGEPESKNFPEQPRLALRKRFAFTATGPGLPWGVYGG